ncbi:MAG: HEAT repeat domain-containing protein [Spirochaetaceae bacterium]|nr:HEAT repeat domain-containing protein [Spirochaetaceae bacterium]
MKYFLLCLILLGTFPIFSETETDSDTEVFTSLKEDRIRTLRYGIDDEVVEIITSIRNEKNDSYNDELLNILIRTGNTKIILPILSFFEEQESDIAASYTLSVLKDAAEDYEVNENVLTASISYSGTIKNTDAVEYLYKLSTFNKPSIAAAAIRMLGKTGDTSFAEKFLERLQDDDYEDDEADLRESAILLMGELQYKPAVPTLIDLVQDDSYSAMSRRFACDSLGKIGDEEAIPVLKELLNDPDSILRSYVLTSLAYFDNDEIEEILIQSLRDSFWRIRVAACKALSERGSESAVEILIYKAEKDPEPNVKKAAMAALSVIGGNQAWDFLSGYFGDNKNSDVFRSAALKALLEENASKATDSIKTVFEEEWEKENSWLFNFTCKELSTTESDSLEWFYSRMLDHKNYIIRIYAVRGIRLNNVISLYGRVKEISDNEDENRQLRKEASSL